MKADNGQTTSSLFTSPLFFNEKYEMKILGYDITKYSEFEQIFIFYVIEILIIDFWESWFSKSFSKISRTFQKKAKC